MATTTPFYHLPLYETGDLADLRDKYNAAMRIIDRTMHQMQVQAEINHPQTIRKETTK
jgi:hypothetical protein|nr:MAG TPA: hypothetical protein [Bacteriophage sp.]